MTAPTLARKPRDRHRVFQRPALVTSWVLGLALALLLARRQHVIELRLPEFLHHLRTFFTFLAFLSPVGLVIVALDIPRWPRRLLYLLGLGVAQLVLLVVVVTQAEGCGKGRLIHQLPVEGGMVSAYLWDCGATTGFGVRIVYEEALIFGLVHTRELHFAYPARDVVMSLDGEEVHCEFTRPTDTPSYAMVLPLDGGG